MKKICVLTGTRAEYGLLFHTIKSIEKSRKLQLQLIVTGSHLSANHGYTINMIKKDNLKIDYEIDMLIDSKSKSSISKSMGLLMIQLSTCFDSLKPDMILVLGDRYEALAFASCAMSMNIPIAHIHGGEATEGAIDEQIRHAITKMSHVHFATTEEYKNNILKMGEQAFRVFNVGAPVMENIRNYNFLLKEQLENELNVQINEPLFLVTYHPVTLADSTLEYQIKNLLDALRKFKGTFIFTGANADFGGQVVNGLIKNYVSENDHCYFFQNLGRLYMDVCNYASIMVGNSSSGIIEGPCFRLPVVNIGDRQKGRLRHGNIIDVGYNTDQIVQGINKALQDNMFRAEMESMQILYGNGTTSSQIVEILENVELNDELRFKRLEFSSFNF